MTLELFCKGTKKYWLAHPAQSLVEFALVLPVLLLIVLGAVDLGRLYNDHVAVTNASREAARYAATNITATSAIQTRANQEAAGAGVTLTSITVQCNVSGVWGNCLDVSGNARVHNGEQVRVTVNANFNFATLFIFRVNQIQLTDYTIMAVTSGLP